MRKRILLTIPAVVLVNFILCLAHMIALFGVAFNDSGAEFHSVILLLPHMIVFVGPLAIGSYFLIRALAERMEFYKTVLYVVQGFFVAWYIGVYIYNYVPDSMFRQAVDAVEEYKSELRQQKRNDEALDYLADTHVEIYDDIEKGRERITIYLCHDSEKVVIRYCDVTAGQEDYCAADISYREGAEPDSIVKYRDLETGKNILLGTIDIAYLEVDENRYLCLNRQTLGVYCEGYKRVLFLYFELMDQAEGYEDLKNGE